MSGTVEIRPVYKDGIWVYEELNSCKDGLKPRPTLPQKAKEVVEKIIRIVENNMTNSKKV